MNMRKILAAMLVVVMVLAMVPVTAQAAESNVVDDTIYESGKLYLDKTATLEDDGTYTIEMEAFATGNVEVTHEIIGKPLDVVLVIDQSGSVANYRYLDGLKTALSTFIANLEENGRKYGKTHRVAVVGFACSDWELSVTHSFGNTDSSPFITNLPLADGSYAQLWTNTGVYLNDGTFKNYQQFEFTPITKSDLPTTASDYYTFYGSYIQPVTGDNSQNREFPLYFTDDTETWPNQTVRRSIYLYNNKWYYDFRTNNGFNNDTTHVPREEVPNMDTRPLYRINYNYDEENGKFVGGYLTDADYQSTFMNVTDGADGQGNTTAALNKIINGLGASGATRTGTGMEMAYNVLMKNELTEQDIADGRERVVIVFTDGVPGQSPFEIDEANLAMHYGGLIKNECKDSGDPATGEDAVEIYTIGLFDDEVFKVGTNGDANKIAQAKLNTDILMNGLSSNWPEADSMDDLYVYAPVNSWNVTSYSNSSFTTVDGYYALVNGVYEPIQVRRTTSWSGITYNFRSANTQTTLPYDVTRSGSFLNYTYTATPDNTYGIYTFGPVEDRTNGGKYYKQAENIEDLKDMFPVLEKTNESTSMESSFLTEGSILRDIMGAGFLLTGETDIDVKTQTGEWASTDSTNTKGRITWHENGVEDDEKGIKDFAFKHVEDPKTLTKPDITDRIQIYNTNPGENNDNVGGNFYQTADGTLNLSAPPTIDITGFNYSEEYIAPNKIGRKLIVRITGVEAQPGVVTYGESNDTNHAQSGLWAPMDEETHQRTLVEKFPMPNTTFTEALYVLDYAKPMNIPLSELKMFKADSLDVDGMNYFNPTVPEITEANGKVVLENGKLVYKPMTTAWDGYDTFYVFGESNLSTITDYSSNRNGNLWSRVNVLPANNVYYEDTFIQAEDGVTVGIVYDGTWEYAQEGENKELPEAGETNYGESPFEGDMPFGGVHGWEDYLADDTGYSDGSATTSSTAGATATFTFTGTGVDIYSYTDMKQGAVMASIYKGDHVPTQEEMDAAMSDKATLEDRLKVKALYSVVMDNFSLSDKYYQIPTLSLHEQYQRDENGNNVKENGKNVLVPLEHGTYTVKLTVVPKTDDADGDGTKTTRYTYTLDGIRIYNPIQNIENDETVQKAYGEEELNASFVEVRDILLDAGNFDADGVYYGVVFLDQVPDFDGVHDSNDGQTGKENDKIGLYECYGPKNEVYLGSSQSVAFLPKAGYKYYVGLKSPTGEEAKVRFQWKGFTQELTINHTTDLYYEIDPYAEDGVVLIENTGGSLLSITKIKVTGPDGSVVEPAEFFEPVDQPTVLRMVRTVREEAAAEPEVPETDPTEPTAPDVDIENPTEPTEPEVPEEGGNDDYLWKLIGGIFDRIRGIIFG